MTVKELIDKLSDMPQDLPVCINDYMGYVEAGEDCIKVERKKYITFPFTKNDEFIYVNLKSSEYGINN